MCLADLSRDEMRDLIGTFNLRAGEIGCVVFHDGHIADSAVVIFAGNVERFHMLAVAQHLRCPVIYVQDLHSGWYQGSSILPALGEFCERFLRPELGSGPTLLFGQSSGAYAALLASTYLAGSTVIACAPQTFSDGALKAKVAFVGVNALSTPDGLTDLRGELQRTPDPDAARMVIIAASELGNPATAHFWMDYLHALRVAESPNTFVSIVHSDSHVIVHGRVHLFADLLRRLVVELSGTVARRKSVTSDFLQEHFSRR